MARTPALDLDTNFGPATGMPVEVVPGIVRVTAPNAGPYTFTGTNSFLVGVERLVVIDPGPNDSGHLKALLAAIDGRPVEAILLTHTHRDHCGLARRLKARTGAPIWSGGPHRLFRPAGWLERQALRRSCDFRLVPDRELHEGDIIAIDGITLNVIETPGHTANHIAFSAKGSPYLFIGDHVMGWSSTVIAPPDGAMGPYLESLQKIIVSPFSYYLPAHGGPIAEGRKFARALLAHREGRNAEILAGVASGATTPKRLLARIYPALKPGLYGAARKTLEAHLDFLVEGGDLKAKRGPWGPRYRLAAGARGD